MASTKALGMNRSRLLSFSRRGASRASHSPGRSKRYGQHRVVLSPTSVRPRSRRWRCSTPQSTSPVWWTARIRGSWFQPQSKASGCQPLPAIDRVRWKSAGWPATTSEIVVDIVVKTLDGTTCVDIRSLRYADVESRPAQVPGGEADPRSFAHAIEWRSWTGDHDGLVPAPGTLAVVGGNSTISMELQSQLTQAGYVPAGIAEARYVVYLAEPGPADDDIDVAARLSSEVVDLIRQLVARHERPAGNTVDHHPRRARGRFQRGTAAEQPMGTCRRHRRRAPGTVGRTRRHPRRRRPRRLRRGAVEGAAGDGEMHPGAARRRIPHPDHGAGRRSTGA